MVYNDIVILIHFENKIFFYFFLLSEYEEIDVGHSRNQCKSTKIFFIMDGRPSFILNSQQFSLCKIFCNKFQNRSKAVRVMAKVRFYFSDTKRLIQTAV